MPPVCKKKGRGFMSVKKRKRHLNAGLRQWFGQPQTLRLAVNQNTNKITATCETTTHDDHSYCKTRDKEDSGNNEESVQLTEINQDDESFNSLEIACSSTPYPSVRRKLNMEEVICDRANISENCDDNLDPLEGISGITLTDDGVPTPYRVTGRRIIDFGSFFNQIQKIDCHNKVMGCSIRNCYVKNEICYGLRSRYTLKCNMCNLELSLSTEDMSDDKFMDINTASVAGAMAIGIGHSQLQELLSTLEIPAMSPTTYTSYHDKIAKGWEDTALNEMKTAASEEIEHAIAEGQVTPDGTPILTVVADGSWAKRSYRTNYNSLSGSKFVI